MAGVAGVDLAWRRLPISNRDRSAGTGGRVRTLCESEASSNIPSLPGPSTRPVRRCQSAVTHHHTARRRRRHCPRPPLLHPRTCCRAALPPPPATPRARDSAGARVLKPAAHPPFERNFWRVNSPARADRQGRGLLLVEREVPLSITRRETRCSAFRPSPAPSLGELWTWTSGAGERRPAGQPWHRPGGGPASVLCCPLDALAFSILSAAALARFLQLLDSGKTPHALLLPAQPPAWFGLRRLSPWRWYSCCSPGEGHRRRGSSAHSRPPASDLAPPWQRCGCVRGRSRRPSPSDGAGRRSAARSNYMPCPG